MNSTDSADPTEAIRQEMVGAINSEQADRNRLESEHGQVWSTDELRQDFSVIGFAAPFIVVVRKSDNVKGSMMFQHSPRFYFGFDPA